MLKDFFSYILDAKGLEKQAGAKKLRGEHVISYLSRRLLMNLVTGSSCYQVCSEVQISS